MFLYMREYIHVYLAHQFDNDKITSAQDIKFYFILIYFHSSEKNVYLIIFTL